MLCGLIALSCLDFHIDSFIYNRETLSYSACLNEGKRDSDWLPIKDEV
jgi:hypothetical protein